MMKLRSLSCTKYMLWYAAFAVPVLCGCGAVSSTPPVRPQGPGGGSTAQGEPVVAAGQKVADLKATAPAPACATCDAAGPRQTPGTPEIKAPEGRGPRDEGRGRDVPPPSVSPAPDPVREAGTGLTEPSSEVVEAPETPTAA